VIIPLLAIAVCIGLIAEGESASSPQASVGSSRDGAAASASEAGKKKPQAQVPKGPPPTKLEMTDLVTGTGTEAQKGDIVTVDYLVVLQKNGKEVYSSWESEPLSFELGKKGSVTAGWQQGIVGMREGGRRKLVAPADLSYGKAGDPPTVGPNEALVSIVDLLKVKARAPAQAQASFP
jgi:peptidylprolyl isomerase